MNAFERQLAGVMVERAGPVGPVDDAAIFTAITATRSPRSRIQPLFSASKLVVAGAIVALFGGLLLAGVLPTQQSDDLVPAAASPSPMSTEELLSRMTTEEVEPGVYRVLDDGAGHDLIAEPPAGVTIAPDGSVWLLRASRDPGADRRMSEDTDAVIELGQDGTFLLAASGILRPPTKHDFVDVAATGGVAWVSIGSNRRPGRWGGDSAQGTLASLDGGVWATPTWPDGASAVGAIEATADGAIWVARNVEDGPGPSVARIEDGEWNMLPALDDPSLEGYYRSPHASFVVAEDGTAWLANGRISWGGDGAPGPTGLLHFDGQRWEVVDLPVEGQIHAGPLALGRDGTLWVYGSAPGNNYLLRLDADGWNVFSGRSNNVGLTLDWADGMPALSTQFYYEARMAVDGDGTLWIAVGGDGGVGYATNALYPSSLDPAPGPVGLLTFDGTTWNQYLRDRHVNRVDVAEDGTVFATVLYGCPTGTACSPYEGDADLDQAGLYVITPEAAAPTE